MNVINQEESVEDFKRKVNEFAKEVRISEKPEIEFRTRKKAYQKD